MSPFSAHCWFDSGYIRVSACDIVGELCAGRVPKVLVASSQTEKSLLLAPNAPVKFGAVCCCSRGDARDATLAPCSLLVRQDRVAMFHGSSKARRRLQWHVHGWFCSGHCTSRCFPGVPCQACKARHHDGFDQCRM